jgi:hypothetical protein
MRVNTALRRAFLAAFTWLRADEDVRKRIGMGDSL